MRPLTPVLLALLLCAALPAQAQQKVDVQLAIKPGLQFDPPRFAVPPGAEVTLHLKNPDQMIHNCVILEPGAREEVVTAALALGPDGPAKNFIPDSPKILWHTEALNPGESTVLKFTAPAKEGVWPYVCTSMGHGFVMYGAMYVTTAPLPRLATDPNIPHADLAANDASELSHIKLDQIVVSRTFLPDCGPAAIAVGLPGGQSYVFDAGLCRLRYAWHGGYVDNRAHWAGKGDDFGKVIGRIYFRAPQAPLIRIGSKDSEPAARWRGYEFTKEGPTFRYTLDGYEVRESPRPLSGDSGLFFQYAISSGGSPVYFVTDPEGGAAFESSAGHWENGVLTLTSKEAASFTLTLRERPGVEPLAYWSMNDVIFPSKKDPSPGVIGRAFTPNGTDGKGGPLATGIHLRDLRKGATLMAWLRLNVPGSGQPESEQPIFTVGQGGAELLSAVHANSQGDGWRHVALTFGPSQSPKWWADDGLSSGPLGSLPPDIIDGTLFSSTAGGGTSEPDDELYLGSAGQKHFLRGLLDEVRVYDRVLSMAELHAIYIREKKEGDIKP